MPLDRYSCLVQCDTVHPFVFKDGPFVMTDRDATAQATYELLRTYGDVTMAETQMEMLQALSSMDATCPTITVLQRLHATEFGQ